MPLVNGAISQAVASLHGLPQLQISEQIVGAPTYAYIVTPPTARTDTVTNTSGSSTITDAAIASGDSGKAVAGVGVPIVSYVGTVTPGVSFVLVDALGNPVDTTAPVSSIVVGAVDLTTVPRGPGGTLPTYVLGSAVGQIGGPAGPLDGAGKLPAAQLPSEATGVQSVTAGNGTIDVDNTDPANPVVMVGTGIPQSDIASLVTDLSTLTSGVASASAAASAAQSTANTALSVADAAVPETVGTAKGDLIVASAAGVITHLGVGTDGQVVSANSGAGTGLTYVTRAAQPQQAGTGLLTGTFGPGGSSGQPTTLSPSAWWTTIAAAVGNLILWVPSLISTGSDAVGDLCSLVSGSPVNFYSDEYGPTQAANGHGGLYLSGDFGIANYTPIKWLVQSSDLSGGTITLAFLYQGGTGSHTWGHASIPSQIDVINYGAHG